MPTYTPKAASKATGASESALRTYTATYARYLSTEATGNPRKFTEADLKLIAFVMDRTKNRALTHEKVREALDSGELDQFEWEPPDTAQPEPEPGQETTALVPMAQLRAAQALFQEAQRREQETRDENKGLQAEINRLQNELGKAQGELTAMRSQKRRPPKWWTTLFGGQES